MLGFYLFVDNVLPFIFAGEGGVAHGAHIGGFLAGAAAALVMNWRAVASKPSDIGAPKEKPSAARRSPRRRWRAGTTRRPPRSISRCRAPAARGALRRPTRFRWPPWLRKHDQPDAALVLLGRVIRGRQRERPDSPRPTRRRGSFSWTTERDAAAAYQYLVKRRFNGCWGPRAPRSPREAAPPSRALREDSRSSSCASGCRSHPNTSALSSRSSPAAVDSWKPGSGHEELVGGEARVAGQIDAEAAQPALVAGRRQVGQVELAPRQLRELLHGLLGGGVGGGADAQRDQGLLEVEADGAVAEEVLAQRADGLDDRRADQVEVFGMPARTLMALSTRADAACISGLLRPVTISPVGSSTAAPVNTPRWPLSAFSSALPAACGPAGPPTGPRA